MSSGHGAADTTEMASDQDFVFGRDEENGDNDQSGKVPMKEIEQLNASLDQLTKENEQVKGRLNLLIGQVDQNNHQIELLRKEKVLNLKEMEQLKEKMAEMEEIRAKLTELEGLKGKIQQIEDSTIPPAVERRGRPCRGPNAGKVRCELCPKRFSHSQAKNLHIQISHQGRRWYCMYCQNQYSSPAARHVHLKRCIVRLSPDAEIAGLMPSTSAAAEAGGRKRSKRQRKMEERTEEMK